eukprot:4105513-Amphidinium_carterae.1
MEVLSIRSQRGLRTWALFPFWDGGACAKEKLHDSPTGKSGMQHFLMRFAGPSTMRSSLI